MSLTARLALSLTARLVSYCKSSLLVCVYRLPGGVYNCTPMSHSMPHIHTIHTYHTYIPYPLTLRHRPPSLPPSLPPTPTHLCNTPPPLYLHCTSPPPSYLVAYLSHKQPSLIYLYSNTHTVTLTHSHPHPEHTHPLLSSPLLSSPLHHHFSSPQLPHRSNDSP